MVTRLLASRLWLCALLLTACGDDFKPRCGTLGRCDVRDATCQASALDYAVCLRGRNESTALQVAVTVQPRDAFIADRIAESQADDTSANRSLRRALALFTMSPTMSTPESETQASFQNTIAIYRQNPPRVIVVDDGYRPTNASGISTLVHEMVHALQDAAGELDRAHAAPRFDAQLALSAVIEGEATIFEDETWTQGYGYSFDKHEYNKALHSFRDNESPYSWQLRRDVFDNLYAGFSYAWGASYLWPLRRDQGAAAILSAHQQLPVSSYAVMELDPSQPQQRPDDLGDQAVPVLPTLTFVGALHLGRYAYDSFTYAFSQAYYLPPGGNFVADTLSVFTAADGTVLTVWRFRFDDPAVVLKTMQALANDHVTLPLFADGADLWLVQSESPMLASSLPTPLTFQAAPLADFGYGPGSATSAQRNCVHHDLPE